MEPTPTYTTNGATDANQDVIIPQTQSEYAELPAGFYAASVTDVEYQPAARYGPQITWKFSLTGDFDGRRVLSWTPAKADDFAPGKKLYKWAAACMGAIAPDYDLRISDLLRCQCVLQLEPLQKEDRVFAKVIAVLPTGAPVTLADAPAEPDYSEELPASWEGWPEK